MVYGLFTFLETFLLFILSFIPYYDYIRLAFFAWLMLPQFQGAKWLYENVVIQQIDAHRDVISDLIDKTQASAESVTG